MAAGDGVLLVRIDHTVGTDRLHNTRVQSAHRHAAEATRLSETTTGIVTIVTARAALGTRAEQILGACRPDSMIVRRVDSMIVRRVSAVPQALFDS